MADTPALTVVERLLLLNQYDILARLSEGEEAEAYREKFHIVLDGDQILYSTLTGCLESRGTTVAEGREVMDILDMYALIQYAVAGDAELSELAVFQGFDGNHETEQFGLVRALIERQGRWASLHREAELNSHSQRLPLYRRMLARFKAIDRPAGRPLTLDEARGLLLCDGAAV